MPRAVSTWCCSTRNVMRAVSVTALCVLTVSTEAQQRVLEHVKCPGQSALDAVLMEPVESVSVYSTLCAH